MLFFSVACKGACFCGMIAGRTAENGAKTEGTVAQMTEEKDIRTMVEEDIAHGEAVWEASSYDSDAMEGLFRLLLEHYIDRIDGFSKDLQVLQPYEGTAERAAVYRNNVRLLLARLHGFWENGCQNEGLVEYYMRREREELHLDADFTTVRLDIGLLQTLSRAEKEEIIRHLDEMEAICARVAPKREKWEALRAHLLWLSGKEVGVAMRLLPLFFRIN